MKKAEIKQFIIRSLDPDMAPEKFARDIEESGGSYDFSKGFSDKVLDALFTPALIIRRETEFIKSMNSAFYRVALTGVAAIVLLMISIFLMEGSFSLNSLLGISDSYDESIVCLLTGN